MIYLSLYATSVRELTLFPSLIKRTAGCVLYEMCVLKHAFDANNLLGLVWKIVQEDYPPIPQHYSTDLKTLIGFVCVMCVWPASPHTCIHASFSWLTDGLVIVSCVVGACYKRIPPSAPT